MKFFVLGRTLFVASLLFLIALPVLADEEAHPHWSSSRPDGHAPLGVMGEHMHHAGGWMLSYRYMRMAMAGNRSGTDGVSTANVLNNFMVAPTSMTMEMHMFGAMYAPRDFLTLMVMIPYLDVQMNHLTRMGARFSTSSTGLGDIKLTGLFRLYEWGRHHLHFNAGFSFPSGSISERGNTPAAANAILPYPMQLGSGTFDLWPGVTYLGQTDNWSWGGQGIGAIRLGTNRRDYKLGNRLHLTAWGARRWTSWLSSSLRLAGQIWGDITGADSALNPAMVPTADPDRRGGERIDLWVGFNFSLPFRFLKGHRVAIEGGLPLYQNLDGPQLETDWQLVVGWQWAF